jgi:hypothetical protein
VHHSEYFRAALSGKFKETDDGIVPLKEVETYAFDMFVDWIYKNKLPPCLHERPAGDRSLVRVEWRAYVLADRFLVPGLKFAILDAFFTWAQVANDFIHSAKTVDYLFENLPEGDVLLRLVVDIFCIHGGVGKMGPRSITTAPELPQAYLVRVLLKLDEISKSDEGQAKLKREDYLRDN